jgi:hypothetical protein
MNDLQSVNATAQRLATITDPKETKQIEAAAIAARAWAKEQQDYETFIAATHLYIMSRRRTTELIQPFIQHGGNFQGHGLVTLNDYGFTKQQWNVRCKELKLSQSEIDGYFDECIAKQWNPSLYGLMRYTAEDESHPVCTCPPRKHLAGCPCAN